MGPNAKADPTFLRRGHTSNRRTLELLLTADHWIDGTMETEMEGSSLITKKSRSSVMGDTTRA